MIHGNKTGDATGGNGGGGEHWTTTGGVGGDAESGRGGRIYCSNSSPTIINCSIESNETGYAAGGDGGQGYEGWNEIYGGNGGSGGFGRSGIGGALYFIGGSPRLTANEIYQNRTGDCLGGLGGRGADAYNFAYPGWEQACILFGS